MSNSGGREQGLSGSPGDSNQTCTQCHSGGSFGGAVSITTDIPAGGYQLNTDYNITVSYTGSSASKFGFQIAAEKTSDNSKTGVFSIPGDGMMKTFNGNQAVTHTVASYVAGRDSWSFTWKSPSTDVGNVKFYAAGVAANENGSTDGDQVTTASTSDFSVLGIAKEKQLDFSLYPNPSSDNINVQLPTGVLKAELNLFDISGRLVKNVQVTSASQLVNVSELSKGIYVLKIEADGKIGAKQFIKK